MRTYIEKWNIEITGDIGSRSRAAGHCRTKGWLVQVDMFLCFSVVDVLSKFVSGAVRVMSIHME